MNKTFVTTAVGGLLTVAVFGAGIYVGEASESTNTDKVQAQVQTLTKERDTARKQVKQAAAAVECYTAWGSMLVEVVHNEFTWDVATLSAAINVANNQLASCERLVGMDGGTDV